MQLLFVCDHNVFLALILEWHLLRKNTFTFQITLRSIHNQNPHLLMSSQIHHDSCFHICKQGHLFLVQLNSNLISEPPSSNPSLNGRGKEPANWVKAPSAKWCSFWDSDWEQGSETGSMKPVPDTVQKIYGFLLCCVEFCIFPRVRSLWTF